MIQHSWTESMEIAKDKGQRETQGLSFLRIRGRSGWEGGGLEWLVHIKLQDTDCYPGDSPMKRAGGPAGLHCTAFVLLLVFQGKGPRKVGGVLNL